MSNATNLQSLRQQDATAVVSPGFGSLQSFELMQRAAKLLSSSTLVPAAYRAVTEKMNKFGEVEKRIENPNALANAVVALNMAQRMGADPLMVMQNLYIVEGRPSWSSQWIIAAINGCGRFSPLRFDITVLGEKEVERTEVYWENKLRQTRTVKVKVIDKVCVAWAIEKETGERIESPKVSIEMAVKEGWYTKNGSKWQTMDEVMLRYRTASFFGKLYAPELLMGLQTVEEMHDVIDVADVQGNASGGYSVTTDELSQQANQTAPEPDKKGTQSPPPAEAMPMDVDPRTGEVIGKDEADHSPDELGLQDALAAIKEGDLVVAQDIARGLSETDRAIVNQAIENKRTTRRRPAAGLDLE
ncbi:MAG: hypothetical protein KBE25_00505 [Laribacter sp.]|nr:hypothetical protein [Laribacter sp.]MBP9607826.1 hypothetical protein [Laribacter sp.]